MDAREIRLEALKLCNRLDVQPEFIVERAKVFEQYILSEGSPVVTCNDEEAPARRSPGRPKRIPTP